MPVAILLNSLMISFAARADDAPCRRDGDRVSCTADGFKTLTNLVVEHRARADKCELRLVDAKKDTEDMVAALHACEAALAAVPPPEPPRSPMRPLIGYALGVVGASALTVALLASVDATPRAVIGTLGLASVAGGAVLVLP